MSSESKENKQIIIVEGKNYKFISADDPYIQNTQIYVPKIPYYFEQFPHLHDTLHKLLLHLKNAREFASTYKEVNMNDFDAQSDFFTLFGAKMKAIQDIKSQLDELIKTTLNPYRLIRCRQNIIRLISSRTPCIHKNLINGSKTTPIERPGLVKEMFNDKELRFYIFREPKKRRNFYIVRKGNKCALMFQYFETRTVLVDEDEDSKKIYARQVVRPDGCRRNYELNHLVSTYVRFQRGKTKCYDLPTEICANKSFEEEAREIRRFLLTKEFKNIRKLPELD